MAIIGAGAAGLMCAIEAGKRGRRVLVVDHAAKPAEKIRISGGGRCNFTNIHSTPKNFISENPHFCVSALSRYTPRAFIALVEKHKIAYHEKTVGQLFCDGSSQQIIQMLLDECAAVDVEIKLNTSVSTVQKTEQGFSLQASSGDLHCESLVIASGGKSIPKMGATGFGYDIAAQFGHKIIETRAGLVPFTFQGAMLETVQSLAGVAVEDVVASCGKTSFREAMLCTHRGLSGPAILQISSYWREGDAVKVNLLPNLDVFEALKQTKKENPKQELHTALGAWLPKRLAAWIAETTGGQGRMADMPDKKLQAVAQAVNAWSILPSGTEGYRTAEVTLGGVDTRELSSKTMESQKVSGLYFIGEVVDVTGHLGGHNFQWAWASGVAAGQAV